MLILSYHKNSQYEEKSDLSRCITALISLFHDGFLMLYVSLTCDDP